MGRADLFNKANEQHKSDWEAQDSRRSGEGGTYVPLPYVALTKEDTVFRILGAPLTLRSKATDPKLIMSSMISGDNDKKFRVIWPSKEDQGNWLLWKILGVVLDGQWKGKEREYTHQLTHPHVFNMVRTNGLTEADGKRFQYEQGWYPKKYVIMNIIDRAAAACACTRLLHPDALACVLR